MEKRPKRARGSNWDHAQTMALAELKREASLKKEDGGLVWERIAQTLSSRFPDQIRTSDQCRGRWDTLVKVYNSIEPFCFETGQDHWELDEGELASMNLATTYHQDWYDIVEQVCSQRKRKERCDRDLMLAERSEGSAGSQFVELPDRLPTTDTLGSTSTSNPTMESANLLPHTFLAKNGNQLKEPPQDVLCDSADAMPFETSVEIEQSNTESEFMEPFGWDLESVGLEAQPKEPLQDDVWDDCLMIIPEDLNLFEEPINACLLKTDIFINCRRRSGEKSMGVSAAFRAAVRAAGGALAGGCALQGPSRRWSLKVILSKIRQSCLARGRKEMIEDLEMESKQAARFKEKALMPRKENVREMLNAASPTSATSETRGDSSLQMDTERISKQSALDKKEEETRSRKAPERQQVGSKSSSKCVLVGKWCAKWSRKLFPAFRGQSSH